MKQFFIGLVIVLLSVYSAMAADVKLDWDAVDGATGYKISMSTDLGATWGAPVDAKMVKPYTYTGVAQDKLILFKVAAYNASGVLTWNEWAYAACDWRKKPLSEPSGAGIK